MKSFLMPVTVVISCLACFGCASGGGMPVDASLAKPPESFKGFAPNATNEIVVARARFVEDYEKLFGEDLIDDYGVIPIAIKIGLKGAGSDQETVYANPQQMDFQLFLEDGTALESIPASQVIKGDSKLESKLNALALHEDDLPTFASATDKYVFFRLAPRKQFELSGHKFLHQAGSVQRTLAIERSLMSFRVLRGGKTLPFNIGITRVQHGTD